jgi:hypothetical protein
VLASCLQFRVVAELGMTGRARAGHLIQLGRHVDEGACRACRNYISSQLSEQGNPVWAAPPVEPA